MKNQFNATNAVRQAGRFGSALACLLLGFPLGTSLATAGEEAQYKFTEIPVPGPSEGVGINDQGLATGYYGDPTKGDVLSFLFERGVVTTGIGAPGATITSVGGANNRGVEGGDYGDETDQQAVIYDIRTRTFTPLPEIPGMPFSFGNGINDAGHLVGAAYASGDWSTGGNGLGRNWIWDGEHYNFFTVPTAVNGALGSGINNRDQVTGYYVDSSGLPQGFVKDGPNFTTINVPGAIYTLAQGINNQGAVAGAYLDASGNHGFIWLKGEFVTVDVNIPGSLGTGWFSVNDHGDLAGVYMDASQVFRAVIAERVDGCEDEHHGE
jgi:hypothetical protein